jgi:probable HAF family extracellular repeat protein
MGWLSPTHNQSTAEAASADGTVIVGRSFLGTTESGAFRWTAGGGMVGLGFLPGHTHSLAVSTNADGSIVVGSSYIYQPGGGYPQEAFRWTAGGGMAGLGFLPGRNASAASAISADGTAIIGGSYITGIAGSSPFRWTQGGGMQNLGMLPGFSSCDAMGLNADGSIVIGTCLPGVSQPFIWTPAGGIRPLGPALVADYGVNLTGWQLVNAFAISPDGRAIVGAGINPSGILEPYLVLLPSACYANCDASTTAPLLNIADFTCFLNRFATGDSRANCDGSTAAPVLNIADFTCFLNRFAAGCS